MAGRGGGFGSDHQKFRCRQAKLQRPLFAKLAGRDRHMAAQPTQSYKLPDNLYRFSASTLSEKTKKGEVPTHSVFELSMI